MILILIPDSDTCQLKDRDREKNKASLIQGKMVISRLHHLQHTVLYGAGWNPPKGTAEKRWWKRSASHLQSFIRSSGSPGRSQTNGGWQTGCLSEGRSGELQVCQPDLEAGENHRAGNFGRCTLCCIRNWLDGQSPRLVVNGAASSCIWSLEVSPRDQYCTKSYQYFY